MINHKIYEFTLMYELPNEKDDPEDYLDSLFEAGLDDSIIGLGNLGYISLYIHCKAKTLEEAVTSSIMKVNKAIPNAKMLMVF